MRRTETERKQAGSGVGIRRGRWEATGKGVRGLGQVSGVEVCICICLNTACMKLQTTTKFQNVPMAGELI